MKPHVLFVAVTLAFVSCNANPPIGPDPIDASTSETSSSSSSASSASSSASSSSSSSTSSSSGGPQGDGSGTRLKRYVYTSDDGLLDGIAGKFYDTLLGAMCYPRVTLGGMRCVPAQTTLVVPVFADMSCTVNAVLLYSQCAEPPYYSTNQSSTCDGSISVSVYQLDKASDQIAFTKQGNTCAAIPAAQLADRVVYLVGPEVDYTQFAPMTLEHE